MYFLKQSSTTETFLSNFSLLRTMNAHDATSTIATNSQRIEYCVNGFIDQSKRSSCITKQAS
uniref:Uncharacterized protein n=1 Tax=uncultured bacterium A1Q1_fos_1815 TaxID=1256553 RepID=L7VR15_9BACT|nr:hypothetical protein [uncultured bacterium A1Q1_fos_1815]